MIKKVTTPYVRLPGFGHKLFVWEYLQIKYGDTHQVVLSDQIYYESEFITFPNTTFEHNEKIRAIKPDWDCIFDTIPMPLNRPIKSLQFDKDLTNRYIANCHPESIMENYNEISTLSKTIRNKNNIIIDDFHKTIPILTKYEKTRILGQRTKQLNEGSNTFIPISESIIDNYIIAII